MSYWGVRTAVGDGIGFVGLMFVAVVLGAIFYFGVVLVCLALAFTVIYWMCRGLAFAWRSGKAWWIQRHQPVAVTYTDTTALSASDYEALDHYLGSQK